MSSAGQERAQAVRALVSVAFAAYVGTLIAGDRAPASVAALTYVVIIVASVALHEAAHAVTVRAVGGVVRGIQLGFGPRLTPPGMLLDLRPLVIAGHVAWTPPPAVRRQQVFAVGVAGIAVHAVLCVVALVAGKGAWPVWRIDLLIANISALSSNLVPSHGGFTTTSGGANDGAQLLTLLRQRGPYLDPADPDLAMARAAYDRAGIEAALAELTQRRDAGALRLATERLATELLAAGHAADAATAARAARATGALCWQTDHLLAEALLSQWLAAPADTPVQEAAAAAERAVAGLSPTATGPLRAAVTHTLGLARLAQGRYDEAGQIARWCLDGTVTPSERASVLATLGWALLALGRRAEAERALRDALSLAPAEPVTRAFAGAFAATPA